MKRFIKLFAIIVLSEFIILMLAAFLSETTGIIHRIAHFTELIFALPLSIINPTYPFYNESMTVTLIACLVNVLIHTAIIFIILKSLQKGKARKIR